MWQFPLFETILIEQGQARNISYHQQRYEKSLLKFYPKMKLQPFDLAKIIAKHTALFTHREGLYVAVLITTIMITFFNAFLINKKFIELLNLFSVIILITV